MFESLQRNYNNVRNKKLTDPTYLSETEGILGTQRSALQQKDENLLFTQLIENALTKGYTQISLPTPEDVIRTQWSGAGLKVYDTPELQNKRIKELEGYKAEQTSSDNYNVTLLRNNHADHLENANRYT